MYNEDDISHRYNFNLITADVLGNIYEDYWVVAQLRPSSDVMFYST